MTQKFVFLTESRSAIEQRDYLKLLYLLCFKLLRFILMDLNSVIIGLLLLPIAVVLIRTLKFSRFNFALLIVNTAFATRWVVLVVNPWPMQRHPHVFMCSLATATVTC